MLINPYRFGNGFSDESNAYFDVVASRGGTISAARKILINQGINYLVAQSQWSLIDRLCVYKNTSEIAALTSLVNPSSTIAQVVNSPLFITEVGYSFDGTTQYLKTKFIPSVDGVNYTLNSSLVGAYWNAIPSGDGSRINLGALDGGQTTIFFAALSPGYSDLRTNSTSGGVSLNKSGMAPGNCFGYNDGAGGGVLINGIASNVFSSNSPISLVTQEIYIGAINVSGVASNFFFASPQKYHIFGSGSLDMTKLNFAMNNYFL